ncbi:unnamed protein product, partial [Chrysoparadoxa australica]
MQRLARAFVFDESLAPEDEEASIEECAEALLWYQPEEDSPVTRLKHLGMVKALMGFTERFKEEGEGKEEGRLRVIHMR